MKRLLIILMGVLLAGCGMKVRIQGIDMGLIKNQAWTKVAAGALASIAAHELAHYAVAEVKDLNPEFDGPTFVRYDREDKWVERAGFLTQAGVGLILNLFPATRDSDFTLGWNGISTAQLFTYNTRNGGEGDFDTTGQNEYLLFSGTATFNTLWTINNQNWKKQTYPFDNLKIESQRQGNWEWGEKFVSIDKPTDRSISRNLFLTNGDRSWRKNQVIKGFTIKSYSKSQTTFRSSQRSYNQKLCLRK